MDIRCKECGQKYHIPDSQIEDKRVYFNCDNCGHKTVVDKRKEKWSLFQGLEKTEPISSNIIEGIFFSFNLKNFTITFFSLFLISIIYGFFALIGWKNISFFSKHTFFSGFLVFTLLLLTNHAFDLILYMISRNSFSKMINQETISFSLIKSEISHNSLVIFLFSSGPVLMAGLLMLPVLVMKTDFGIVYSGIFYGLLSVIFSVIIFVSLFKNIIIAFTATKNRSVKSFFKNFFRFLSVENINIPVYSFLIFVTVSTVAFITWSITSAALTGVSGIMTSLFASEGFSLLSSQNFAALISAKGSVEAGFILIAISLFLITLFLSAFFINLSQTLACTSLQLMESNPGRSVNRTLLFTGIITFTIIIVFTFLFLKF